MNSRTQNRLIGLIAILLVLVVFSPRMEKKKSFEINNGLQSTTLSTGWQAENRMKVSRNVIASENENIVEPVRRRPLSKNIEAKLADVPKVVKVEKVKLKSKKDYTIQLVALKNRQKIEELLALLKLHNYQAYIDPGDHAVDQVIRLYVGSYSSKELAESAIIELDNLTKLRGIVVNRQ